MFILVRTDDSGKPQEGITFLLLDMNTPGIRVEPILFASGTHEVNQVFFDDARVPKVNVVGQENKGWQVAKYLLEFERGGSTGGNAARKVSLQRLRNLARLIPQADGALSDDADFMRKLDETEVQLEAIQYTEFRLMAALSKGDSPAQVFVIRRCLLDHSAYYRANRGGDGPVCRCQPSSKPSVAMSPRRA